MERHPRNGSGAFPSPVATSVASVSYTIFTVCAQETGRTGAGERGLPARPLRHPAGERDVRSHKSVPFSESLAHVSGRMPDTAGWKPALPRARLLCFLASHCEIRITATRRRRDVARHSNVEFWRPQWGRFSLSRTPRLDIGMSSYAALPQPLIAEGDADGFP